MIVKNEEKVLARCLDSVKPAVDEIVILDTGSTDATKDVAARYTDRIYDFPWVDDFSAARNASFAKASMTFTMWLDADDVLLPEDLEALIQLKSQLDTLDADVIMLLYRPAVYAEAGDIEAENDNTMEVIVAKHRNGPTGVIRLAWLSEFTRFTDLSDRQES